MQPYQHYSLDLWGTLIKSNPNFKIERAKYFFKQYNTLNKTIEEVAYIFRTVDVMCNAINEKTGSHITAEEMYLMVLYQLNHSLDMVAAINLPLLYTSIEQLLLNYPPIAFQANTAQVLRQLKEKNGVTLNILSNTAFIKGSTLRKILDDLTFTQYFSFQLYSDEVNLSKPNPLLYQMLVKNIASLHLYHTISLQNIVHIGDNPIADIEGAMAAGLQAFQINTNHFTITDLLQPCT
jgi:putative hydrolase of the HAD superfamily